MNILYPEIETMSHKDIENDQLKKINEILSNVQKTPYYKEKLPNKINSLKEMSKLPFLSKNDLREAFPYELLSCSEEKLVRMSASSGTTGIPTISYATKQDLETFSKNEALHYSHTGLSSGDVIQCMVGFNLFTAGWGCYYGAIELGSLVIPAGPGNTQRQIDLLKQLKANYCFSNPGYLQYLLETISDEDWKDISLKIAITGGEVLTKEFQKLAKDRYNIEVYNFYGMTEFATHIASECYLHNGLHINEDCFYAEIIDPKTEEVLPDGEYGELVLTDLRREAMPLIRYKTHDYTRIIPEPCACGRTHKKIEAIQCRIDNMMIINGVNVFPSQIEECLYKSLTFPTDYLVHVSQKKGLKKLAIDIELPDNIINNNIELNEIERRLLKNLKAYITVTPKLNFIPKGSIPRQQGKLNRIIFE